MTGKKQAIAVLLMAGTSIASLSLTVPRASAAPSTDASISVDSSTASSATSNLLENVSNKTASTSQQAKKDDTVANLVKETAKLGSRTIKADWGDDTEYISDLSKRVSEAGSVSDWAVVTDTYKSRTCVFRSFCGAWVCVQRFDCAVGTVQSDGHSGTFAGNKTIDHKAEKTDEGNGWWSCTVPWWGENGEDDGQGFHDGFDGTTGMITHGCTRLYSENAKYIYDNVPVGSRVIVI